MRGPKNHDRHRKEATNAIQVNGRTRKRRKNRRSKHIEVGYLHIRKQQTGIKKGTCFTLANESKHQVKSYSRNKQRVLLTAMQYKQSVIVHMQWNYTLQAMDSKRTQHKQECTNGSKHL